MFACTLQQSHSFIIKKSDNVSDLRNQLQEVSAATGVRFDAANTAWTEEGPDLGSNDVQFLEKPKVALITQMPTDPTSFGAMDYLFDQRYGFPMTAVPAHLLNDINLSDYNVLILPDQGELSSYDAIFGKEGVEQLKNWVSGGGTLIGVAGGGAFLVDQSDLSKVKRIKKFKKDSSEPATERKEGEEEEEKEPEEETELPDVIPGAIARVKLNTKHFLTFGYDTAELPVFLNTSNVFEAPPGEKPVASYVDAEHLKMSGLIWDISKQRLENKVYLMEESLGQGHVIVFAEDPTFRAYWEGLEKLFFNGALFGPSM
jgi:hypothetical protein